MANSIEQGRTPSAETEWQWFEKQERERLEIIEIHYKPNSVELEWQWFRRQGRERLNITEIHYKPNSSSRKNVSYFASFYLSFFPGFQQDYWNVAFFNFMVLEIEPSHAKPKCTIALVYFMVSMFWNMDGTTHLRDLVLTSMHKACTGPLQECPLHPVTTSARCMFS